MLSPEELVERIRAFLATKFRNYELQIDEDIFAAGFVNSMFAMQLVLFVEKNFGVQVEEDDLDLDNFRSIDAIRRFIELKIGARSE